LHTSLSWGMATTNSKKRFWGSVWMQSPIKVCTRCCCGC
jgi:hypothetical protein